MINLGRPERAVLLKPAPGRDPAALAAKYPVIVGGAPANSTFARQIGADSCEADVGDGRISYDVTKKTVEVLAIVPKDGAEEWLEKAGESYENGSIE